MEILKKWWFWVIIAIIIIGGIMWYNSSQKTKLTAEEQRVYNKLYTCDANIINVNDTNEVFKKCGITAEEMPFAIKAIKKLRLKAALMGFNS